MAVDLKKWKQRNAAERVKAALTKPKKDNTAERLRRQFSAAAGKALQALNAKGRNPWLRYGYNDEVVVTARLGRNIIPVTGDEAIALKPQDAEAYLRDVISAAGAGQLDRELLKTAGPAKASRPPKAEPQRVPSTGTAGAQVHAAAPRTEPPLRSEPPVRIQFGLRDER